MFALPTVPSSNHARLEKQQTLAPLLDRLHWNILECNARRRELADLSLCYENPPFNILNTEQEAVWVQQQQEKVNRRKSRREWELVTLHRMTPPGPWDEDLDRYHGDNATHTWDLGDGYQGRISRNASCSWSGSVVVPEGHWACGKDFHEVSVTISFNLMHGTERTFGFDHTTAYDTVPLETYEFCVDNHFSGKLLAQVFPLLVKPYYTREMVMMEVHQLKFKLDIDPSVPPLGPSPAGGYWFEEEESQPPAESARS